MSDYKDLFESACRWQQKADHYKGESERYEKAWLAEVKRYDQLRDMYENAVHELSEVRAMHLRQAQTITYLQREYEHASASSDHHADRLHDAMRAGE